jgi:glycosyltransferase involved in cell wall biosynthesis
MRFIIITHALHYQEGQRIESYAPYVREMNLWIKAVGKVEIVGPIDAEFDANINLAYQHQNIKLTSIPSFSLLSVKELFKTLFNLPQLIWIIFKAIQGADHIHLRCPGNVGLLACWVQIFFPKTTKTAKYAGNWDPKAKQPWSYKLQKWILSNTYLTKNMQVLVYGVWPNQSKNIKPFFTATYFEHEKEALYTRNYKDLLKFCFIGSLSPGKQPALAFELVKQLREKGTEAELHIYGNGVLFDSLQAKVKEQEAGAWVKFLGNQPKEVVRKVLQYSHFLVLPSKSEGWPKVAAEAMFWGCVPIVTPISCVPWMLNDGKRGILMDDENLNSTIKRLKNLLSKPEELEHMSAKAALWSRDYTLDKFEEEIAKLIHD